MHISITVFKIYYNSVFFSELAETTGYRGSMNKTSGKGQLMKGQVSLTLTRSDPEKIT